MSQNGLAVPIRFENLLGAKGDAYIASLAPMQKDI
jgi:hypothetical protein